MANPNPVRPCNEVLFQGKWRTGKTVQQRIPVAIKDPVMAIARLIDQNPAIASDIIQFAQSKLEQSK